MFILFGRFNDVNLGIIANNLLVMDVNKWSWISSVSAVAPVDLANEPSSDPTAISNGSSDNKGVIAGAVVGAVAGISIIAGAIFFCIRRRRNQSSNNGKNEYVAHNNNVPSSSSEEAPPLQYYNTDIDNNNVNQPMLISRDIPHCKFTIIKRKKKTSAALYPSIIILYYLDTNFIYTAVDGSDSSGRGYIRSPTSTDNTSTWHDRSTYYGSEKPDASLSPASFSENSEPIRLTLKPVKPDGA